MNHLWQVEDTGAWVDQTLSSREKRRKKPEAPAPRTVDALWPFPVCIRSVPEQARRVDVQALRAAIRAGLVAVDHDVTDARYVAHRSDASRSALDELCHAVQARVLNMLRSASTAPQVLGPPFEQAVLSAIEQGVRGLQQRAAGSKLVVKRSHLGGNALDELVDALENEVLSLVLSSL